MATMMTTETALMSAAACQAVSPERLNASVKQAQEAAESRSKAWPRQSPAPASSRLAPPKASTPASTIP